MFPVTGRRLLSSNYVYLKRNLELEYTTLLDHLYQGAIINFIQLEDINETQFRRKKSEKLLCFLMNKKQASYIQDFLAALDDQSHIREHLLKNQDMDTKKSRDQAVAISNKTPTYNDEAMDEDIEEDSSHTAESSSVSEESSSESEEGSSETDEDSGYPLMKLIDLKTAPGIQHLAVRVTVLVREQTEVKTGQEQFMAMVADDTSAVRVCVRNSIDLFKKVKVGVSLLLENVQWSGNVLFANEKCTVISVAPIYVKQNVIDEAFGQGKAVPISKALTLPGKSWVPLKGKIVKQSVLTKEYTSFEKLLTHRQIKLKDQSGSVYVHVWGDVAVNLKAGDVINIKGLKIQKSAADDDDLEMSSTIMSSIKTLHNSELKEVHRETKYERASIDGINVEIYASCPKRMCYHFKLDDASYCKSCKSTIRDPDMFATAIICVVTPKKKIRKLKVLWPQLRKLYRLFDKSVSLESGMQTLEEKFGHLQGKSVRFHTCGIVRKFRRE